MKNNLKFSSLSKIEVQAILEEYMKRNHPEKMKFKPKVVYYDDEILKFGMWKHHGILCMSTEILKSYN